MPLRVLAHVLVPVVLVLAGCGGSGGDAPADTPAPPASGRGGLTAENLVGEWCQRYTPPEEPGEAALEERLILVFEADGVFRLGQSRDGLGSLGSWSLDGGVIRMPGNPVGARVTPTRVTEDAFEFRGMGVDVTVTRGACPPA